MSMINQKQIISAFFFAFLIFVLYQLFLIWSPFFHALFWASVLTFAFYPLHKKIQDLVPHPSLAALVTTFLVVLMVILPAIFVVEKLLVQTVQFYEFVKGGGLGRILDTVKSDPRLQILAHRVGDLHILPLSPSEIANQFMRKFANAAAAQVAATTRNLFSILLNVLLAVLLLFFFLRDGKRIYHHVYDLAPLEPADKPLIFGKINDTLGSVIRGQILTSIAQGVASGVVYKLLGLPAPHFLGFLTFLATLIPIVGTTAVWVPLAAYLFMTQEVTRGIILCAVGVFFISAIDNVLKPVIIGERMKMPILPLFIAVLGGIKVYGITGIFLGPLFITLFFALTEIYKTRYR